MFYMVSDHPGKGNLKFGCIVVLKARSRKNRGEILLACLGNEQSKEWIETFRKAFIKMISGLKGKSNRNILRAIQYLVEKFFSRNPIRDSLPPICGIICVDHTFFRFQNTGTIYFLNTRLGYGNAGLKCMPDSFDMPECGNYEEQVGILLTTGADEGMKFMTDEEEKKWLRTLQSDNVNTSHQMEKRLHESMEYVFNEQYTYGPMIWIVPRKTPENVSDDQKD